MQNEFTKSLFRELRLTFRENPEIGDAILDHAEIHEAAVERVESTEILAMKVKEIFLKAIDLLGEVVEAPPGRFSRMLVAEAARISEFVSGENQRFATVLAKRDLSTQEVEHFMGEFILEYKTRLDQLEANLNS